MNIKNINIIPDILWVEITPQTKDALVKQVKFKFDKYNLKDDQSLHHITLAFKPTLEDVALIEKWAKKDEIITIKIEENCWNEKIQALKVRLFNSNNEELVSSKKIFHITVSAKIGTPPKLSNEMLFGTHNFEKFVKTISGKIVYKKF